MLFTDIVGYSKLPLDRQKEVLGTLQAVVSSTPEFLQAQASHQMIRLPTGDGMAVVFFEDAEAAARCAVEVSRALKSHPEIPLRMGLHSGPVYRVADINANQNVAGGGINIAQRVMDCGDAGHILASQSVADVLGHLTRWKEHLHDLGETDVKHGIRIHLYNVYTEEVGNAQLQDKLQTAQKRLAAIRSRARRKRLAIGMVAAATAALAIAWLLYPRHAHALKSTDTVVLADFANSTGDPVFDDTLKQGLATDLQQSPFFHILPDRKTRAALKLMGHSPDDRLTAETAQDICQRTQSKAVIAGSISSLGSQYVVGLNAVNCQSGESLARETAQAVKKEDVLNALDHAATQLREKVGESVSSIQKYEIPLAQNTTASLEALKAYTLGRNANNQIGAAAGIPHLRQAIEFDPKFAAAYLDLGIAYRNLGELDLARENIQKAFDLRDQRSEKEKLSISAAYFTTVTGQLEKSSENYELWIQEFPQDFGPHNNLAINDVYVGQHEKALAQTLEALRLAPDSSITYGNLVGLYCYLNRFQDAKATYQEAINRKLDFPTLRYSRYAVAFVEADEPEMDRQSVWGAGDAGVEGVLLSDEAATKAYSGHLQKARELSLLATGSDRRADEKELAAEEQLNAALREAEYGNIARARTEATSAMALASTRGVNILAALVFARAGDSVRAEKMADALEKQNPLDTLVISYWLPTIRAAIEIDRENPSKAVEILLTAAPYELGTPDPGPEVGATLYPVYVRGHALLLLHQGSDAAVEFQKFLDHKGLVINCPFGALAHLGLARAYALQGDATRARAAYQDFLTLWKDADPDIPILKEAKAEYAKLR